MPIDSIQRIKAIAPIADTIHDTLRDYIHDTIPSVIYVVGKGQDDIWGISNGNFIPTLIGGILSGVVAFYIAKLVTKQESKERAFEEKKRHLFQVKRYSYALFLEIGKPGYQRAHKKAIDCLVDAHHYFYIYDDDAEFIGERLDKLLDYALEGATANVEAARITQDEISERIHLLISAKIANRSKK